MKNFTKTIFRNVLIVLCALITVLTILYLIQDYVYWLKRSPRDIKVAIRKNHELVASRINAVKLYYNYHGFVPESLESMVNDPVGRQSWIQITNNPWGHPIGYSFSKNGTNTIVEIWSYGCDNKPGGHGAAADVIMKWSPEGSKKPSVDVKDEKGKVCGSET